MATRALYSVQLENFTVKEPPAPEPAVVEVAEEAMEVAAETVATAAEAAAEAEGEAEEGMEEMEMEEQSGPQPRDIILHLLVRFSGDEPLAGVTVEVTQADPFGKEKAPTLHYIETANMTKSDVRQVDLQIEGLEFEDGDAFAVNLREVVPAEDRGSYREFAEAAH